MPPAVLCEGLKKRYGPNEALRGLDLEVPEGSLFGLLGPNGAGKSTTLRILAGLVHADAGRAEIHGVDVRRHVAAAKETTFLIENAVFPPHLTAREVLARAASFLRVPADDTQLDRVGLSHAGDRRVGGFSHGMRQRLGLACALLGRPRLLVLDEPQNGLDPQGLRAIRDLLREEHARGATVLVSVHRLAEVDGLCTHAAILVNGRVLRAGPIGRFLGEDEPRYRIEVSDARRAREALAGFPCTLADGALLLDGDREQAAAAAAACVRAGVKVFSLEPVRRRLDDVYLEQTEGLGAGPAGERRR